MVGLFCGCDDVLLFCGLLCLVRVLFGVGGVVVWWCDLCCVVLCLCLFVDV